MIISKRECIFFTYLYIYHNRIINEIRNQFMKNLHLHLLKASNWLLVSLLVLLGFSCSSEEGEPPIVCEYGTPYASFQVKGKVKDSKGTPIPNAQIRVSLDNSSDYWMRSDTIYSDKDGAFEWKQTYFPTKNFIFITEDAGKDIPERQFASDTTQVVFESFEGGSGWNAGHAAKEMDIVLKDYVDTHTEPYSLYTIYGRITDQAGYPLPGILVLTNPAYSVHMDENNAATFPAITNSSGHYKFTYDKAAATKHMIHARVYSGYWNYPDACAPDSVEVDFSEIELSGGNGMLIGKGSKEVNFQLKRKY